MTVYQLSGILNALVACMVSALCFSGRPSSKLDRSFVYFAIAVSLWSVPAAVTQFISSIFYQLVMWKISVLGIIAVAPAFYNFAINLLARKKKRASTLKAICAGAVIVTALDISPLMIRGISARCPVPGPAFFVLILYFAAVLAAGLTLIEEYRAGLTGLGKDEIKYYFTASIVFFIGIISNWIFWYGIPSARFGSILAGAGIATMYAFTRFSLIEIRLTFTRAGIFTVIYAFILIIPFWLGIKTEKWQLSVALMGILASIGPFIYGILGKKVKDILLARQRQYQQMLLQISQSMIKHHDIDKLTKYIVYAVKKSVRIQYAAIFVNSNDDEAYMLRAVKDLGRMHPKFFFSYKHPLVSFMKAHKKPVTIDELPQTLDGFKEIDLGIRLIVPSFMDERLVCFLLLGDKLDKTPYSEDDINVFLTLAGQTALAVENCLYLEEFERAQERIFSADKLASLGGMADGVAHQIKNRLNQFSIAAGEQQYEIEEFMKKHKKVVDSTPELKKTFEYLVEISASMLENVKKTTNVIQGVISFAHVEEKGAGFSTFDVDDIIKPTLELLCVKHQISRFPISIIAGKSHVIYGVKSQVMECLYNLLDNAYEAFKEKKDYHVKDKDSFEAEIFFKVSKKDKYSVLEVSDNGIGIKEENMNKIFAPFFTTKSSFKTGGGVGMYVVKRMVEENHKGKIRVESEYLKGTRVYLELPEAAN